MQFGGQNGNQAWVKDKFGFVPKTCWIAHLKEVLSLPVRVAPNRMRVDSHSNPCPERRKAALIAAFIHFDMIREERAV
jgi:hypothetical protein